MPGAGLGAAEADGAEKLPQEGRRGKLVAGSVLGTSLPGVGGSGDGPVVTMPWLGAVPDGSVPTARLAVLPSGRAVGAPSAGSRVNGDSGDVPDATSGGLLDGDTPSAVPAVALLSCGMPARGTPGVLSVLGTPEAAGVALELPSHAMVAVSLLVGDAVPSSAALIGVLLMRAAGRVPVPYSWREGVIFAPSTRDRDVATLGLAGGDLSPSTCAAGILGTGEESPGERPPPGGDTAGAVLGTCPVSLGVASVCRAAAATSSAFPGAGNGTVGTCSVLVTSSAMAGGPRAGVVARGRVAGLDPSSPAPVGVPGSAASLTPAVAGGKVLAAEDAPGGAAGGGILDPSVAVRRGPPLAAGAVGSVTGPPRAAGGSTERIVSPGEAGETLAAVAGGEVAASSSGVAFWDRSTVVACGSAGLSLMRGGDVPVLCEAGDGTVLHAVPSVPSAVTALRGCANSRASLALLVAEEGAFVPSSG